MAHNQGGLNGIESIQGVQPPDTSAVERVTLLRNDSDYNLNRTNTVNNQTNFLGLTSQAHLRQTEPFDSRMFDYMMPNTSLGRTVFNPEEGNNLHTIG